jgi:hypothetical protein
MESQTKEEKSDWGRKVRKIRLGRKSQTREGKLDWGMKVRLGREIQTG